MLVEYHITIRLPNQELDKLNFMIESSGEKFKSYFIRKLILNEEVRAKENFELKKNRRQARWDFKKSNTRKN